MDREHTPEPVGIDSLPFKAGEDPPETTVPRNVHTIMPDTPKKGENFVCAGCGTLKHKHKCYMTDCNYNQYCVDCY